MKKALIYVYRVGSQFNKAIILQSNKSKIKPLQLKCSSRPIVTSTKLLSSKKFSEKELKKKLTTLQYHVTQEKGTEQPFTGLYDQHKGYGQYNCVVCGEKLFESVHKFDAMCGWPSFYKTATKDSVKEHLDTSYGMIRTEVTCKSCNAHLGHVFNDGPYRNSLRYCINSASLSFAKHDDESGSEKY